jgi:hypothetical protein
VARLAEAALFKSGKEPECARDRALTRADARQRSRAVKLMFNRHGVSPYREVLALDAAGAVAGFKGLLLSYLSQSLG